MAKPSLTDFISGSFWAGLVDKAFTDPLGRINENKQLEAYEQPYQQSYEDLVAIKQSASRGFKTVDIDPSLLDRSEYLCQLSPGVIAQLTGFEVDYIDQGFSAESPQLPSWRTFSFSANADWVKIEYLPIPVNDILNYSAPLPDETELPAFANPEYIPWDPVTNTPTLTNATGRNDGQRYQATRGGTVNFGAGNIVFAAGNIAFWQFTGFPPYNGAWANVGSAALENDVSTFVPMKTVATQILLVNFEDTTSNAPIVARDGDVFKLPFSTIFLTFKAWGPRIRLTFGYNAEIQAAEDNRMHSPAYWPGHGVTKGYLNPVPFAINDKDTGGQFYTDVGNPVSYEVLIANTNIYDPANETGGCLVGWITGFQLAASAGGGGAAGFLEFWAELFVGSASVPATTYRRLASIVGSVQNDGSQAFDTDRSFTEPIRFVLQQGQALTLKARCQTVGLGTFCNIRFAVEGYVHGALAGSGFSGNQTPFGPQFKLMQQPYPMDRLITGAPKP